jgi:hypothetical protein
MSPLNQPIAYDFHGDIPFSTPFRKIDPENIHIYLDLDTKIGKQTCGQACTHCWFVNYEKVHNKQFNIDEGVVIKKSLEQIGYKVFARYVDSFAYNGDFMRLYGPVHNREFRQENGHVPTKTMHKGDAWTSGAPLLKDNYLEILDLAAESGYGTISMTFHGLFDENINFKPESEYPIKGVFHGQSLETVVQRIKHYNLNREAKDQLRVNIGITIGKHNHERESLIRYVHYFNHLGVDTVRFNNFTDHGGRHSDLPLLKEEVEALYKNIKWIHENLEMKFQLALSEDFGTFGIEVMGFPQHVGNCQAGRQLFTVIPSDEKLLKETKNEKVEKIGDIVGCVNIFEPYLGALLRITDFKNNDINYSLEFDYKAIDDFTELRLNGHFKNGCFAKELKDQVKIELTKVALNSQKNNLHPKLEKGVLWTATF